MPLVAILLLASGRRLYWPVLWRCLPGGLLLCGDIALFFSAVKLTSIADATMIGALQPVLVLFIAKPLFNERVSPVDMAWTALVVVGMAAVVLGQGQAIAHDQVIGDLLAVGALCCWTSYWLLSKRAAQCACCEFFRGVTCCCSRSRQHRVHRRGNAGSGRGDGTRNSAFQGALDNRHRAGLVMAQLARITARDCPPPFQLGTSVPGHIGVNGDRVGQPGDSSRCRGSGTAPVARSLASSGGPDCACRCRNGGAESSEARAGQGGDINMKARGSSVQPYGWDETMGLAETIPVTRMVRSWPGRKC